MVQLRTQRTALILYGVLLVLPTLVLGGLQWNQLLREYDKERDAVPQQAEEAAARFLGAISDRLARLVESEERRQFTEYGAMMLASDERLAESTPVTTPLLAEPRPQAILAWFAFDLRDRFPASIDLWAGSTPPAQRGLSQYEPPVRQLFTRYLEERQAFRLSSRWDAPRIVDVSLLPVVFNRMHKRDPDCLQYGQDRLAQRKVTLLITPFHLQFFLDDAGEPRLLATRRVLLEGPVPELDSFGACFDTLSEGMSVIQGFLIDPKWIFQTLPADLAKTVLDSSQRFVPWGGPPCCGDNREYHADIHLLADLPVETSDPSELNFAPLRIAVDTTAIDSTFQGVWLRFLGLVAMLAVSLGTGMWLLLRSVRKDLDRAARTENFVAAVTHELRTPLTSIKMYGEMLLDGEASEPEKQREYYKRIVRATERLGTLVERVLEKSRLSAGSPRAEPGDLNHVIGGLERQLAQYGPEGDLSFDLDPEVPDVLLTHDAVVSIVSNLVENARKYAPVDPSKPGAEPILVRTRVERGEVSLEVLDRGAGVPEHERERIFEAFYRLGTEATRTATGAGLGLHLVLLQARSIGGDAGCRAREGGGSIFWVHFAPAEPQ